MQGVILSFDPKTKTGLIMTDNAERETFTISPNALDNSLFETLRQGQRVNFDIDENEDTEDSKVATNIRLGSEVDMGISTARI